MNDQRFFDLAIKVIAGQATDAERAELESGLADHRELKTEFEGLEAEVRLVKETLPLIAATESSCGEFPGYARERLQTTVSQTLRSREATGASKKTRIAWRWGLGLALAAALVLLIRPAWVGSHNELVVQVAVLDLTGATRGSQSESGVQIQRLWEDGIIHTFSDEEALAAWQNEWPEKLKRPVVKIVYDRAAAELRVSGHWKDRVFEQTFTVEGDLQPALNQADAFIKKETAR